MRTTTAKPCKSRLLVRITFLSAVLGCAALAACRTPSAHRTSDFVTLSNEVARLRQRVEVLEKEQREAEGTARATDTLLEELRDKPVIEESLIGVPDAGGR